MHEESAATELSVERSSQERPRLLLLARRDPVLLHGCK
jgi:hypothetical protein